jgi:2-amino-4-hydroxy-6-hydroxymethyldihydropteridine diphosphokinase
VALDVVVGLGSNLGDRLAHLRGAVHEVGRVFEVRARSSVFETAPWGPPQPDYLNAAIRILAATDIDQVLCALLDIERRGGRVRSADARWGARTIDLDILWAEGVTRSTETLTVPHARLTERAFALCPLLEVAPDARDPRTGLPFAPPPPDPGVRRTALVL